MILIHQTLKQEGYNWDVASTRAEEIYNVLPFPDADKVHKEMVDNAEAVERTQALGREVIRCARRKRSGQVSEITKQQRKCCQKQQ